jgi:phosphoribosylformimino-5-aminoimidazole carboxamide ribotide isomerase
MALGAGHPAVEAIDMLASAGILTFEVTSIAHDGLLEGPDLELLRGLVERGRGRIIASGGVASVGDVLAVQAIGCAGVIVGRALYEGRIEIAEAIAAIGGGERRIG